MAFWRICTVQCVTAHTKRVDPVNTQAVSMCHEALLPSVALTSAWQHWTSQAIQNWMRIHLGALKLAAPPSGHTCQCHAGDIHVIKHAQCVYCR
jgi:hypothetical protein